MILQFCCRNVRTCLVPKYIRCLSTVKSNQDNLVAGENFSKVAKEYDRMLNVFTFGLHHYCKNKLIGKIQPIKNNKLLDVAGGTGDITLKYLNKMRRLGYIDIPPVTVCDLSERMMKVGKMKAKSLGIKPESIIWKRGDAEYLPFEDNQFGLYTMAFGIKFISNREKCLSEVLRVLEPDGRFLCVELNSKLNSKSMQKIYKWYLLKMVPRIGAVVLGNRETFRHAMQCALEFPLPLKFADHMREAGFKDVSADIVAPFGMATIYSGYKP